MLAGILIATMTPWAASAAPPVNEPTASLLVSGLQGASGSTVGPGGDLYVTEGITGTILRVDPRTGEVETFASGLPTRVARIGGAMDLAFIGQTAYVLVTLVGPDVGGSDIVGIYRVDGPNSFTVIVDIGAFAIENPPDTPFAVPTGVQYALEVYRGGLLVTDGHHNRLLHVTLDGEVTEFASFENIVPTGLAVSGNTIYMAEAGPVPHLPQDGRIVAIDPRSGTVRPLASGAPLLVDVEFGRGRQLYALAQGVFEGPRDGFPAAPNTGSLVAVNGDGSFTVVLEPLNQPTSLDFIGNTAYVVNLAGEIWKIEDVGSLPFGVLK
jgi:sugar lactone lactonase YvrE